MWIVELYSYSTEVLSRRYRHLFKLPSFPFLSLALAGSNAILFALLWRFNRVSIQTNVFGFASIFFSAIFLTFAIHRIDDSSIASARRVFGLFLVASLNWLLFYSAGIAYSMLSENSNASLTGFILGGFLAIGLELLVINGVFLHSTIWSFLLSLMHPLTIFSLLLIASSSSSSLNILNHLFPLIVGTFIIALVLLFLFRMKHFETRRHNISSLNLLQAFLKTWTCKNPKELEQYFTIYSQSQETITKIVKFVTPTKDIILVLPDVHPGPFYPVGSYNLSETIHRQLRMNGSLSIVLHGTGGHERNLPSNYYTNEYAERIRNFVASLSTDSNHRTRGPLQVVLGQTTVTCIAFDNEILMTITNIPYNSDDLDPAILQEIKMAATETGFGISVVDAHNCIGGEDGQGLKATREEWRTVFERLRTMHAAEELHMGYSHSSETGFIPGADISEGGIGLLIFENNGPKSVLIVADSNNVLVGLRETIAQSLKDKGFQLMELCTSDTHNLAARSLVQRGYFALGEATPKEKIIEVISDLVSLADRRIGTCEFVVASFPLNIPLIGNEPLEDFAAVTNKAFAFSRTFTKIMVPITLALIAVTTILF